MANLILLSLISLDLKGLGQVIMQELLGFIHFDTLMTESWLVPWLCSLD